VIKISSYSYNLGVSLKQFGEALERLTGPHYHFRPKDFKPGQELVGIWSWDLEKFREAFGEPTKYTFKEWKKRMAIIKL
jgi:hypothetical protein